MGVEIGWMCSGTISASISVSILAADAKEKQFWVTQLRACAKYHMETSSKVSNHGHAGWDWDNLDGHPSAHVASSLGKLFLLLFFKLSTVTEFILVLLNLN